MTYKILLVISKFPPEYSGPGVRIPRLYEWLKKNHEPCCIEVLCNGIEYTKSERYTHKGLHVKRVGSGWIGGVVQRILPVPQRYKHSLLYQIEFLKTLWGFSLSRSYRDIDLLHVAGHSGSTAAALLWAGICNKPVLTELVTANAPHRQKFLYFFKTPQLRQQKVIALTRDMKEKCLKSGLPVEQIWCRPNPIDEAKFFMPSEEEKEKLRALVSPFQKDQIILASVAKIMPQKNQLLVLKALSYLPEKFVALIAGPLIAEGPLYERDRAYFRDMTDFIAQNNLEHRVHIVNDFVDAREYMQAGDIYMMPAWNEGFGTPMIEALGCGLPVIANKNEPAFQEWITHGENGALCDIDCPKEWAEAIESAALLSRSQRLNISKDILENAGQSGIYAQYRDIIRELVEKVT